MFVILILALAADPQFTVVNKCPPVFVVENKIPINDAAAAPTPIVDVLRAVSLLPTPKVAAVDIGCGDGRVVIAMAEKWSNIPIIGIEIDPARAAACRERVKLLGLKNVTIITGDATKTDFKADVAFVYLTKHVLEQLQPKLSAMQVVVAYLHQPPGLPCVRNGDFWVYTRPVQQVTSVSTAIQPYAVWQGRIYYAPECDKLNCGMCAEIRRQLATFTQAVATPKSAVQSVSSPAQPPGRWVKFKFCNGRSCWFEDRWVPDP